MDYSGPQATGLYKYQWDNIHDPEAMLFAWLEEEGEGELKSTENKEFVKSVIDYIRNYYQANPEKRELNINQFGDLNDYYGKIELIEKRNVNIRVFVGIDAFQSNNIIINIDNLIEYDCYEGMHKYNHCFFLKNEARNDKADALIVSCDINDKYIVKDYLLGHDLHSYYKIETIVKGKLVYNYSLSRYEDSKGSELGIDDFIKTISENCIIEGGEFHLQNLDEEIISLRNGIKSAVKLGDPILDFDAFAEKAYCLAPLLAALIDLSNVARGESPVTMIPYFGNCVEGLEYFAGWNSLEEDVEWLDATIDYRKMVNFINKYGNIYNVGFIYTDNDIFKELKKNLFTISNDYSPTNVPRMISEKYNPNISIVYWGYLSEDGAMIIQGKLDYY